MVRMAHGPRASARPYRCATRRTEEERRRERRPSGHMQLVRSTQRDEQQAAIMSVADFVDSIDHRQGRHLRRALDRRRRRGAVSSPSARRPVVQHVPRPSTAERGTLFAALLFTLAGLWWMRSQGLWLARVSAIRVVEITRITRALVITAVTMFTFDRIVHFGLYVRQITAATLIALGPGHRVALGLPHVADIGPRLHDRYCRRVITHRHRRRHGPAPRPVHHPPRARRPRRRRGRRAAAQAERARSRVDVARHDRRRRATSSSRPTSTA